MGSGRRHVYELFLTRVIVISFPVCDLTAHRQWVIYEVPGRLSSEMTCRYLHRYIMNATQCEFCASLAVVRVAYRTDFESDSSLLTRLSLMCVVLVEGFSETGV